MFEQLGKITIPLLNLVVLFDIEADLFFYLFIQVLKGDTQSPGKEKAGDYNIGQGIGNLLFSAIKERPKKGKKAPPTALPSTIR